MKKLILGATLAIMYATGFGDAKAILGIGANNKLSILTLREANPTPRADASFVMGAIDDMLDSIEFSIATGTSQATTSKVDAAVYYKAYVNEYKSDKRQLKIIRKAFETIARMEKISNIKTAIAKAITAMNTLSQTF